MPSLPLLYRSLASAIVVMLAGCTGISCWTTPPSRSEVGVIENPMFVPITNPELVWPAIIDVVGEYFRIDHEEPVRLLGNTLTEGRLETYPKIGATVFEPWDHDTANQYERLESTLQSIRRYTVVRVVPVPTGGFWVEVTVFKELEDLRQPEHATAGAATFRYDVTQNRLANPLVIPTIHQGWISQGRDAALEQRMLAQLQYRLSPEGQPIPLQ
jgi:hypothetical protein